jgi:cobalt-zinc-cadmium efflux system membrane fusion protein
MIRRTAAIALLLVGVIGCQKPPAAEHGHAHGAGAPHEHADDAEAHHDPLAVTAWGERYEIFAEADPLVVGAESTAHTHVTILSDFSPLRKGVVEAILVDEQGVDETFRQETALRDGIFSIAIKPRRAGTFDFRFRVVSDAGDETIPAGRVIVGEGHPAGGLAVEPAYGPEGATPPPGDEISFLKEQQWRTAFATRWATLGALHRSVTGRGRTRPAAGGEVLLSAPVDGVVDASFRAHVGQAVGAGAVVAGLRPRLDGGRSVTQLRTERQLAAERLDRLEKLLAAEAASPADVDRARAAVRTLTAELDALEGKGPSAPVRAPFAGRLAEVFVVAGQSVDAGAPLARIVRDGPVWVEVSLAPADAEAAAGGVAGLVLRTPGRAVPLRFESPAVRFVARSPQATAATGAIPVLFAVEAADSLATGLAVDVDVLLAEERIGIVVPADAVVDDGGVPVIYVQNGGESFTRQEVRVVADQGDRLLVEGPIRGARIVTRGGAAIRRAVLLETGPPEGHVH